MKMIKPLIIIFIAAFSFTSCWREKLDDCWKDNVHLIFTVEKFQAAPEGESAAVMSELVDFLDYYLFKVEGSELIPVDSGRVDKESLGGDSYEIAFNELPFGQYVIAAVANNNQKFANVKDTSDLKVDYLEPYNSNRYYVALKSFTVDCYCNFTDFVKLYNTCGKLELRLADLPDNIVGADVTIDNVYDNCAVDTIYSGNKTLQSYIEVEEQAIEGNDGSTILKKNINFDLFTFPTISSLASTVTITLYMDTYGGSPVQATVYQISGVDIQRNQTYRISKDFKGSIVANPHFDISINPDWDGVNDGSDGGVEI